MNPSFNIVSAVTNTANSSLLIEISGQGISFIVIDETNICTALSVYHFDAGATLDKVATYLKDITTDQKILQLPFKKISVVYGFAASLLVPHQFINVSRNDEMLELVYGDDSESIIRSDFIDSHKLNNVYRVPKQVDLVIAHLFSQATHYHLYSLLPHVTKKKGNQLYCIFGTTRMTVQLLKEGRLQVIQNFQYKVPEDAVYNLLNVCQRFEVEANNVVVHLTGMIDPESNLYNEIYKFFLNPQFGYLPELFIYNPEIEKYPAHYFSHLFELASCV